MLHCPEEAESLCYKRLSYELVCFSHALKLSRSPILSFPLPSFFSPLSLRSIIKSYSADLEDTTLFIDTHVHLHFKHYAADIDAVLARAAEAGVQACILPATNLEDSRQVLAFCDRFTAAPCALYAALGFHPTEAHLATPAALAELRALAQHPRVVAIGEIGLDFYWPQVQDRTWPCASPDEQRAAFVAQLELAADLNLPVIVHDRDAHAETLALLRAWRADQPQRTGTLHAYAGGPALLQDALDLGFFIGMDGPVTFARATALHAVAQTVPLERLLLETDGPYLTPEPHRGQRNEPAYLPLIAARIAALRGLPVSTLGAVTAGNARQLFRLD